MDLDLFDQYYKEAIRKKFKWLGGILDANYKKSRLEQDVSKLNHLNKFQPVILLVSLKFYKKKW